MVKWHIFWALGLPVVYKSLTSNVTVITNLETIQRSRSGIKTPFLLVKSSRVRSRVRKERRIWTELQLISREKYQGILLLKLDFTVVRIDTLFEDFHKYYTLLRLLATHILCLCRYNLYCFGNFLKFYSPLSQFITQYMYHCCTWALILHHIEAKSRQCYISTPNRFLTIYNYRGSWVNNWIQTSPQLYTALFQKSTIIYIRRACIHEIKNTSKCARKHGWNLCSHSRFHRSFHWKFVPYNNMF